MSDLLIKGVKMPQGCRQCHFKEWTNSRAGWFCPLRHKFLSMRVIIQDKRYGDCPLVEIPPYSKLIDANMVYQELLPYSNRFRKSVLKVIGNIPIIIERSE